MLLTLRVTGQYASDLAVMLGHNPDEIVAAKLPFGLAHVFFSEVSSDSTTVSLMVDVSAVDWSSNDLHGKFAKANAAMLSVAIATALRSALLAHCPDKPRLVAEPLPIEVVLTSLALARGVEDVQALFAPLGYAIQVAAAGSDRHSVRLSKTGLLHEVLSHLYVIGPVLDQSVSDRALDGEVAEVTAHAEGFVRGHPAADRIMQAYATRKPSRVQLAVTHLLAIDLHRSTHDVAALDPTVGSQLDEARTDAVITALRTASPQTVLDLGCGDGKLIARLVREKGLTKIVGVDIAHEQLDMAAVRMKLDRRAGKKSERLELLQSSLFYKDNRLTGFDAALLVDVVQHVDPMRLGELDRVVFEHARPTTVIAMVTNISDASDRPNRWSTSQFDRWSNGISGRFGYRMLLSTIGTVNPARLAVFSR